MKFNIFILAFSTVVAVPHKSLLKRPNHDFIDYYDCSGKADGSYNHPYDCTRFISCSNGNAADMACGDCDQNNVAQCAGSKYLFYDKSIDACNWPASTSCETDTVTPGPDTTPETAVTSIPDYTICEGIKAGDSCHSCRQCGYCWDRHSFYFRCQRTIPSDPKDNVTGVIVHEACDKDLWWNPELKPDGVGVGGACDFWNNLDEAVMRSYNKDPNCVTPVEICEYGQDDGLQCTENYWFYDPAKMTDREDLTCPGDLLWDQSTETCRACGHVRYSDGNQCPCNL